MTFINEKNLIFFKIQFLSQEIFQHTYALQEIGGYISYFILTH